MSPEKQTASHEKATDKAQQPTDPVGCENLPVEFDLAAAQAAAQLARNNPRQLRPRDVLQLQHMTGNQAVLRSGVLRTPAVPPATRAIQREVSAEVTPHTATLRLNYAGEKEVRIGRARLGFKAEPSATVVVTGKHEAPLDAGVSTSDGAKVSLPLFRPQDQAEATQKFTELVKSSVTEGEGYDIDTENATIDIGGNKEGSGQESEVSMSLAVNLPHKNGKTSTANLTLFKAGGNVGVEGPALGLEHTIPLAGQVLVDNDYCKIEVQADVKVGVEVKPDWVRMFWSLANKARALGSAGRTVATWLLRAGARAAVTGVSGSAILTGSIIIAGVSTIAAGVAGMAAAADLRTAAAEANRSAKDFASGFCAGVGFAGHGASGPAFAEGQAEGQKRLRQAAQNVLAQVADMGYGEEQCMELMKEVLAEQEGAIYSNALEEAKKRIFPEVVLAYYNTRNASWYNPEPIVRNDAEILADSLGVSRSVLPPPTEG